MADLIPSPPLPRLPVAGSDAVFPVARIFCVGRNYASHAREMGGDPDREAPFFFSKPAGALVPGGGDVPYPPATEELHHEVELVVALGAGGRDLTSAQAGACVLGHAVGLDLTRRDLQREAKRRGRPWALAKGFDAAAPCGPLALAGETGPLAEGAIRLWVGERLAQDGDLAQMIWSVPDTLAHLSRLVTLQPADLVFTGTPAGVGPLVRGDRVRARIEGLPELSVTVI